jgi:osmotically-inducible protein OsmY
VGKTLGTVQTSEEAALSASIRTKLSLTQGIKSSNYKLVMENGTVYLMGIQQDADEWQRARAVIADSYGVQKIICLIREKEILKS